MTKLLRSFSILFFLIASLALSAQTTPDTTARKADSDGIEGEITHKSGTYIIDVAKSYLSGVGSAKEVLLNIPFIQLIGDNRIAVMGKAETKIMINRRRIFNLSELQQIQSNTIHSIQIETISKSGHPYPTIFIITKEHLGDGLSGNISLELLYNKPKESIYNNNSLDLSYKIGTLEIISSLAYKIYHYNIEEEREQTIEKINYSSEQLIDEVSKEKDWRSSLGFIKTLNKNHAFGAIYRGEYSPIPSLKSKGRSTYHLDGKQYASSTLSNHTNVQHATHEVSAFYNGEIKNKHKLTVHLDYAKGYLNSNAFIKEEFSQPVTNYAGVQLLTEELHNIDKNNFYLLSGNLSVEHPLRPVSLAYGLEFYNTEFNCHATDHLNGQMDDLFKENKNKINQHELVGFATMQKQWGKFSGEAGLRYEFNKIRQTTNGNLSRDTFSAKIIPHFSLGYQLSDDLEMTISYNEELDYFDFHSLQKNYIYHGFDLFYTGNPSLKPTHVRRANYLLSWRSFQLFATYSSINNALFNVGHRLNERHVVVMQPQNMPRFENFSMGVSTNFKYRRWEPNIALSVNKPYLKYNQRSYSTPIFSYMINNTFSLPKDWHLLVLFNGATKGHEGIAYFDRFYNLDIALKKVFLKDKNLSLTLRYNDIFTSGEKEAEIYTNGVSFVDHEHNLKEGAMIQLTYRFNQFKKKGNSTSSERQLERLFIEHE